jgi:putative transcriptional regulator
VTAAAFESTVAGLEDALAYARGDRSRGVAHEIEAPDSIFAGCASSSVSRNRKFAAMFRVSVATVRNWEQGRRGPEGRARVLLTVIDREPDAVRRALPG